MKGIHAVLGRALVLATALIATHPSLAQSGNTVTNANITTDLYEAFDWMKPKQTSVVLDGSSGQRAMICLNPQSIKIADRNGKVILETNVIEALVSFFQVKNPDELPILGDKKVGSLQVVNGCLLLNVGKLIVSVDPKNGQIRPEGSD